ncbi:T9SS type A sorting domain-containing protein [Wenyingzhuangia aestuarii]|uniref:T9SS type A sorting domain-containing protein n=1 Tax=Wenyingzhuangia aestuarii TaxID=1647582 RepID=UPI001438E983|nr:T9SS type A sorting domain-containing protein [Wenyingzhuangia aestuarii]NJB82793.1 hypothetical protein [Wenyingzhuangia aestuarii]
MYKHILFTLTSLMSSILVFSQEINGLTIPKSQITSEIISDAPINNEPNKSQFNQHINKEAKLSLDSIISYGKNESTGEWDKKIFKEFFLYSNYRDTVVEKSSWDNENNDWKIRVKEIKKYNDQNNIIHYEHHLISKSKKRIDYNYTDKGDLVEIINSKWLVELYKWLQIEKMTKHYNSKGLLQVDTSYTKYTDSDAWVLKSRKVYTYDTKNHILADTTYIKQKNAHEWELFSTTKYEYNSGHLVNELFSRWNSDVAKLIPYTRKEILYETNNWNVLATNEYKWDKTIDEWIIDLKHTFGYDAYNLLNSITNNYFDSETTNKKNVFSFDYSIKKEDLILPSSYSNFDAFHHKIISNEYFNNELEKYREANFYYSDAGSLSIIDNTSQEVLVVYPNPAKKSLFVNFPKIYNQALFELYDIRGNKIISSTINNGEEIKINTLKKGVYIYSIICEQNRIAGKLIKD